MYEDNEHLRSYCEFLREHRDAYLAWRGGRTVSIPDTWQGVWGRRKRQLSPSSNRDFQESTSASAGTNSSVGQSSHCELIGDSTKLFAPCPEAPHTEFWKTTEKNLRRRKQGIDKALEYLYLFAAEDWCVQGMSHYINDKAVNPTCTSQGRTAHEYATATAKKRRISMPSEVKELLASHGR